MVTWVLFLGVGLVIGVIAGLYFARLDDVTNSQKKALQHKLEAAEQQMKTYQSQVTEHFLQTAGLVNSMTESYKAVHEHLAKGAKQLCDSQVTVAQLEMPGVKLLDSAAALESAEAKTDVAPEIEVVEKQARPASGQESIVAQKPELPDESQPEVQLSDKASSKEPTDQQAEPPKEAVEAIQPPSTPESLHMDDSEEDASKSLKDSEQPSAATVSRMVH